MVLVETDGRVARYRLLEPIRQYALERLEAVQEASVVRARHAAVIFDLAHSCAAIGGSAAHADDGDDEIAALDRLECEHDNLRAALRWALGHQHGDEALRAAAGLCVFWERRGHFQEGCAWLEEALAVAGGTSTARARSMALNALAGLYWRGGDVARAQAISQQALLASRQAGDAAMEAWALGNLGASAYFAERPGQAVDWLERSVALGRQVGHPALLSVGLSLLARARLGLDGADEPAVAVLLDEAVQRAEAAGSRYALGYALTAKGDLLWRQGRTGGAISAWRRALVARAALADRRGVAGCLERLAWGLGAREHFAFAACAFGAAAAQHRLLGVALRHDEGLDHAERLASVRRHLSDETFAASWAAGQSDDLQDMVRRVLDWTNADAAIEAHEHPGHGVPPTIGTAGS
jgi:tetratricopeptide (TPR) repeat protein